MSRVYIHRNRGRQCIDAPGQFTIDGCGFFLFPLALVVSRRTIREIRLEEDYASIRGAGLILPEADRHFGRIVFHYPVERSSVVQLLFQTFISSSFGERLPDGCWFSQHYLKYTVVVGEEEVGTVEEILKPYLPPYARN
jgi:hypothetical protein